MLIEVMVGIVVFGLLAAAVLGAVSLSVKLSRTAKDRSVAAHLADREVEITRVNFLQNYANFAGGRTDVNPDPLPSQTGNAIVDGNAYTVTRIVKVIPQGNDNQSACAGNGNVTYIEYLVDVQVTWKDMNGARPVQADTILTPDKSVVSGTTGYLGVSVTSSTGQPVTNQAVTLTGPATITGTTDSTGCFVGVLPTSGTYTATIGPAGPTTSVTGWVDAYGNTTPSKQEAVTGGTFSTIPLTFDKAANITATATTPVGYAAPSTPGITVYNSAVENPIATSGELSFTSMTATDLWPIGDGVVNTGYSVWAGTCVDDDPSAEGGSRAATVPTAPGATAPTTNTTVPLGGLNITVLQGSTPQAGKAATITVTHAADGSQGCTSPVTLTYPTQTTSATGVVKIALPFGLWSVSVSSSSKVGSTSTTMLANSATSPQSVTVVTS